MKLAFFGLGAIGSPMSKRLIDNGYDVNLYTRKKLVIKYYRRQRILHNYFVDNLWLI